MMPIFLSFNIVPDINPNFLYPCAFLLKVIRSHLVFYLIRDFSQILCFPVSISVTLVPFFSFSLLFPTSKL
jgi:hypothetical protein